MSEDYILEVTSEAPAVFCSVLCNRVRRSQTFKKRFETETTTLNYILR